MGVDLPSYRFSIGVWSSVVAASIKLSHFGSRLRQTSVTYSRHSYFVAVLYLFLLLRAVALPRAGDVHRNPGPSSSPPFYNSNLNSKPDSNRGCSQGGRVRSTRGAASLSGSTLSVLQFNARSLHPKLLELADVVSHLQPDIVAITETWLTNAVPDGVLLLPDYGSIVRADRGSTGVKTSRCGGGKQRGGGVLLLIKNSIN